MLSYSYKLKIPDGDVNNFSTKQPNLSVILFLFCSTFFFSIGPAKKKIVTGFLRCRRKILRFYYTNFMHAYYDGMTLDETFHVAFVNISTDVQ